jgi:HJR/Mrr/RecB family endonuclease
MTQPKKRQSKRTRRPARPRQRLAWVDIGSELGRLYFPVKSRADAERRREELINRAFEFEAKSLFIKENTSPDFLEGLAADFAAAVPQVLDFAAARFATSLFEKYLEKLKHAIASDEGDLIVSSRTFLSTKKRSRNLIFDPPASFPEHLIDVSRELMKPLFTSARSGGKYDFWLSFAQWIWMNQMAQAMESLEESIGSSELEQLPDAELFNRVLRTFAECPDVPEEFARLMEFHLNELVEILTSVEVMEKLSLSELEILFGLVESPQGGRVNVHFPEISERIKSLLVAPATLYELSPRAFEEVVAFGLEKSGFDEVRLTPPTRDGGFDIEAFRYGPVRERLLVECKRYALSHKVGRPTLDALLGVLHREKANKALLATSSTFSKEAQRLLNQEQWRLQGMDLDELLEFLRRIRLN